MNPYNPYSNITNENDLYAWIAEREHEEFEKLFKLSPIESFEKRINQIFKKANNDLNKIM